VSFKQLTENPQENIKRIYAQLGWDSFDDETKSTYPNRLEMQCEELKGYQQNKYKHVIIDDQLKQTIRERWKLQFQKLGYDEVYPFDPVD